MTVELISARGREHDKTLGVAYIANDGKLSDGSDSLRGSYDAKLWGTPRGHRPPWRHVRVENFARKSRNAWELLYEVLLRAVGHKATAAEGHGFVYALSEPVGLAIRYVGKTTQLPTKRLAQHVGERHRGHSHLQNWIRSLRPLSPVLTILDEVPLADLNDAERQWITDLRADGLSLTNYTEGGTGGDTWSGRSHTEESKKKIAAALTGKPKSESHKAALRGPKSEEAKRKMRASAWLRWHGQNAGRRMFDVEP